jgi:hypothetical protein
MQNCKKGCHGELWDPQYGALGKGEICVVKAAYKYIVMETYQGKNRE